MNTINKSTGFSPFQLRYCRSARVLPPLLPPPPNPSNEYINAQAVMEEITTNVADARDNLLLAKITQAFHSNSSGGAMVSYKVGDKVMLSTLNSVIYRIFSDLLHRSPAFPRHSRLFPTISVCSMPLSIRSVLLRCLLDYSVIRSFHVFRLFLSIPLFQLVSFQFSILGSDRSESRSPSDPFTFLFSHNPVCR